MYTKIALFFTFLTSSVSAAYIGNPAAPSVMSTGFFSTHNPIIKGTSGYIADYITDKNYKASKSNPHFNPNDVFKEFIIHSQLASFSVVFLERLELFGTIGGSKPRLKKPGEKLSIDDLKDLILDFDSGYQLSWSTGGKVILMQWGQTFLCTDFTYFAIPKSPASYLQFFNQLKLPISFGKQELSLHDWQFSTAIASKLFFITPYAGGIFLKSKLDFEASQKMGSFDYRNEKSFGYFCGFTLSLSGRFHLNFEQRFRCEKSYTFSTIGVF